MHSICASFILVSHIITNQRWVQSLLVNLDSPPRSKFWCWSWDAVSERAILACHHQLSKPLRRRVTENGISFSTPGFLCPFILGKVSTQYTSWGIRPWGGKRNVKISRPYIRRFFRMRRYGFSQNIASYYLLSFFGGTRVYYLSFLRFGCTWIRY